MAHFDIPILLTLQPIKAVYRRHETFISDVRLPAMSLGLRLYASREAGQGEVGGFQLSAPLLGLALKNSWVGHFSPPVNQANLASLTSPEMVSKMCQFWRCEHT